jgi:hypothetical protein
MTDTHTPGPWQADEGAGNRNADGSHPWEVCACAGPPFGDDTEIIVLAERVTEANARLIAAAPELLAACRAALEHFAEFHRGQPFAISGIIWAAVAKAEGR